MKCTLNERCSKQKDLNLAVSITAENVGLVTPATQVEEKTSKRFLSTIKPLVGFCLMKATRCVRRRAVEVL